jgi:hypothetical protein
MFRKGHRSVRIHAMFDLDKDLLLCSEISFHLFPIQLMEIPTCKPKFNLKCDADTMVTTTGIPILRKVKLKQVYCNQF